MSKHISNITKQISHTVYVLGKIRKYINNQAALTIYKTMVLPYFDYGDIFYMNANEQLLNKLQVLQNKCTNLHREANVANLKIRRRWHLRNFMFRMKENESLVDERGINTRTHDAINFIIKQPRCEKYKSSVYYLGATEWNAMDNTMRLVENFDEFKFVQKTWALWHNYVGQYD